ncbi:MAG: HAD family hydrolase [Butyricicoccaceae bacterium]
MKLRGAIFDLDGTVLDSMPMWNEVGIRYLTDRDLPVPPGVRDKFKTMTLMQSAEYYHNELGVQEQPEQILQDIERTILHDYQHTIPLKEGVREVLDELKARGVRMGVATATARGCVEPALERLGVSDYFSFVLTCTEVGRGKTYPDIFEQSLARLGTCKQDTVVFEDAIHAIQTAKSAGFRVAAVYDESSAHEREEISALSDVYLNHWCEFQYE